jgi:biopolymer transport protein ExbD
MAATIRSNTDIAPDINTTPLIDVMLVLLTLLIMTLPMQTHAIKIDTGPGEPVKPPPVVTVGIEFDGSATWNGTPVSRATLDAYLADAARQNPQPDIVISADRLAKYGSVALVLADAARAGETHVGFAQ